MATTRPLVARSGPFVSKKSEGPAGGGTPTGLSSTTGGMIDGWMVPFRAM
jgi:hypothetical protein